MTALILDGIKQDRQKEDWRHDQDLKKVARACLAPTLRDPGTVAFNVAMAMSVVNSMKPRDIDTAKVMMQVVCDGVLRDQLGAGYADAMANVPLSLGAIKDPRPRLKLPGMGKKLKR